MRRVVVEFALGDLHGIDETSYLVPTGVTLDPHGSLSGLELALISVLALNCLLIGLLVSSRRKRRKCSTAQ